MLPSDLAPENSYSRVTTNTNALLKSSISIYGLSDCSEKGKATAVENAHQSIGIEVVTAAFPGSLL